MEFAVSRQGRFSATFGISFPGPGNHNKHAADLPHHTWKIRDGAAMATALPPADPQPVERTTEDTEFTEACQMNQSTKYLDIHSSLWPRCSLW